jgi:putative hydrolase of the HAD superfamily
VTAKWAAAARDAYTWDEDDMTRPLFRPTALLLDLFDTLVSGAAVPSTTLPTWEELGIPIEAYQRRWFQNHDGRAIGRVRDPVEVLRVVAHDIDPTIPLGTIERAAERRLRRFEEVLAHTDPATVGALARLRALGVRMALVSNACFGEIESWPHSPLAAHFDAAVFSCQVGAAKPDPAIYLEALRQVGAEPALAIFAGDGNSDELRGAREVGLSTVLISGFAERYWSHALPDRRVHADWEFPTVVALADALERA